MSPQVFFEPEFFSGHTQSLSTFLHICSCFFNVLVFNVSSTKGEKEKLSGGIKGCHLFKALGSH